MMTNLGRLLATAIIWIAGMLGLGKLIESFSIPIYTMIEQTVPGINNGVATIPIPMVTGAEWAPGGTVIVLALLAFVLVAGIVASTLAIWTAARDTASRAHEAARYHPNPDAGKLKRDQQERVRRLLERMDADDLAELENQLAVGADGELVSMHDLLREQRRLNRE